MTNLFTEEHLDLIRSRSQLGRKTYPKKGQGPDSREHLVLRLARAVEIDPGTACWLWRRHTTKGGYGKLTFNRKSIYAHRIAFELAKGPIEQGYEVCHKCDNPGCINPEHLFQGLHSANMRDSWKKGRKNIPENQLGGELHPNAKLTKDQVEAIRSRLETGEPQTAIAAEFGISQANISYIKNKLRW